MSTTIDSKVVEMRFDNSNFEKNAQQSMSTLEKLKSKITQSTSAKSLEDLGTAASNNNVKFDGLANSVNALSNRFSTMGIVATTALMNITNRAVDAGIALTKSLSIDNVTAGFDKFEKKTKSVGTLVSQGFNIDVVDKQLDRLAWFTDETSYNFTDMVDNISKFTATGQELEPSVNAMEGIATWAALSGQNAQKASQAMYQLSQAMGKGVLQYDDWKSIQNANMDTLEFRQNAVKAAIELGQLKKTGEDTFETLGGKVFDLSKLFTSDALSKQKWFTSDVMMKTFKQYSAAVDELYEITDKTGMTASQAMEKYGNSLDAFGLKAFKAAQEARSWGDVVDSVKDAVSSGWMETFELIFGNYEQATKLFTDLANNLWDIFASGAEGRNDFISELVTPSWDKLTDKISDCGIELSDFNTEMENVAKQDRFVYAQLIKDHGSFEQALKNGAVSSTYFTKALDNIIEKNSVVSDSTEEVVTNIKDLEGIVNKVINGSFGNGAKRMKELEKAGYDYAQVQDLVNRKLKGEKINFEELSEAQAKQLGLTEEQIAALKDLQSEAGDSESELRKLLDTMNKPTARDLAIEGLNNILGSIIDTIYTVREAWTEIFPPEDLQAKIYSIIESFRDFTERLVFTEEKTDKLKRTLKGLFAAIDIVGRAFGSVFRAIRNVLSAFGAFETDILGTTASIGDYLVSLDESIKANDTFYKGLEPIVNVLKNVIHWFKETGSSIRTMVGNIKGTDEFKSLAEYIETKYNRGLEILNQHLEKNDTFLTKILDKIKKIKSEKFEKVFESIKEALAKIDFEKIDDFFNNMKKRFGDIKDALTDLFQNGDTTKLKAMFDSAKESITSFCDVVSQKLKDLQPLLITGGIIGAFVFFGKALNKFTALINSVKNGFGIFDSISGAFNELKKSFKWDIVLKVALAIGLIAGALLVLSKIPDADLAKASKAMIGVAIGMGVFAAGLATLNKLSGGAGQAALGVLALSTSIGIIVGALYVLTKMMGDDKFDDMKKAGDILAHVIILMSGIAIILSHAAPEMSKGGLGLIAFAAAVSIIANVLVKVANKKTANELLLGLQALLPVFLALLAVSFVIDKFSFNSSMGLLTMCLGIVTVLRTLEYLSKHKLDIAKLGDNIETVIAVFGTLLVLAGIARLAGDSFKGGLGVLALSASLMIIVKAMQELTKIPDNAVWKVTILSIVMGLVTEILANSLRDTKGASVAAIIAIAASMLALTGALVILSTIDAKKLIAPVLGLSLLMFTLGEALFKINSIEGGGLKGSIKNIGLIILGVGAMAAIAFVLSRIAGYNWKQLAAASLGISVCMLAVAASLKIINGVKVNKSAALAFAEGVLLLSGIALAISFIAGYNPAGIVASAVGLSIAIIAVGTCMRIISGLEVKDFWRVAGMFSLAIAGLIGIAAAISLIAGYDWKNLLGAAGALSITLIALSGCLAILSAIGPVAQNAIKVSAAITLASAGLIGIAFAISLIAGYNWQDMQAAVIGLNATLVVLSVVVAALGALGPQIVAVGVLGLDIIVANVLAIIALLGLVNDTGESVIKRGLNIIKILAEGFGSAISGFAKGLTTDLPGIGENLSGFMNNMSDFFEGCRTFNPSMKENLKAIIESIELLSKAKISNGLGNLFGGKDSLTDLAENLTDFGIKYKKFANSLGDIDNNRLTNSIKVVQSIGELANSIPRTGGLVQFITGDNSLKTFCEGLYEASSEIKKVSDISISISPSSVSNFKMAVQSLLDLTNDLPKLGGISSFIFGEASIQQFCKGLEAAAIEVNGISANGLRLDLTGVDNFCSAIKKLLYLEPLLSEMHGGLKQKITGDDSIQVFCQGLGSSAGAINSLGSVSAGINLENIDLFCNALRRLIKLEGLLTENHGGIKQIFTGDDSIQFFCSGLTSSANELIQLSNTGSSINIDAIDNFVRSVEKVVRLANYISIMGTDSEVINAYSSTMRALANDMVDVANIVSGINTEEFAAKVQSMLNSMMSLNVMTGDQAAAVTSQIQNLAQIIVQEFTTSFDASSENIVPAIMRFIEVITTTFSLYQGTFNLKFGQILLTMLNEFSNKANVARAKAEYMCRICVDAIMAYKSKFVEAGRYAALGFAEGMNSGMGAVREKASQLANEAYNAAMSALNAHSPSRRFIEVGGYAGAGFVIGLDNYRSAVSTSAYSLGDTAVQSVNDSIKNISDVIDANMDLNPVIKPTLDISDVQRKAQNLDGLWSTSNVLSGNVSENQNGTGAGVWNFTQNNYSPKALSRIDIYRQTKNQFSQMKGLIGG